MMLSDRKTSLVDQLRHLKADTSFSTKASQEQCEMTCWSHLREEAKRRHSVTALLQVYPGCALPPEGCLRSERRGRGTVAATATSSPRWRGDRHLVSMANVNSCRSPRARNGPRGRAARSARPAPRPAVTSGPQPDQARPSAGRGALGSFQLWANARLTRDCGTCVGSGLA